MNRRVLLTAAAVLAAGVAAAYADDPESNGSTDASGPPTAGGTAAIDREHEASSQPGPDSTETPRSVDGGAHPDDPPLIDPRHALNPLEEASGGPADRDASHPTGDGADTPLDAAPAHESVPIGEPVGLFESEDGRQAGGGSWLGSIDPRRNMLSRTLIALIGVVALIAGLAAIVRRVGGPLAGGGRPSGVIEILARYPIGRGQQLMILKMDRRVLLLHHAGTSMTPVSEVTDPDEVASLLARIEAGSRRSAGPSFADMLGRQSASSASAMTTPSSLGRTESAPSARTPAAGAGSETVDLTRSSGGPLSRLFRGGGGGS